MRKMLLLTAALGTGLLLDGGISRADELILAQASGTNLGTPQTQPLPGGGVGAGPGAPTSASPSAGQPSAGQSTGRGAPSPGSATPTPGGGDTSGGLTPGGAIRPGTTAPGGTGGSSN